MCGTAGNVVPPPEFLPAVQSIAKEFNALTISDEMQTGFGRTGNWFGSDTFAIRPDLMAMAKGLSSGYLPISAVMVSDRVADVLIEKCGEFAHGFTYSGHPVAAAVALANIELLQREKIVETVGADTGPYFQERLRAEFSDHPLVGEVRGVGMVAAIELVKDKGKRLPFDPQGDVGTICRDHSFHNGLVMRATKDSMILSPPLIISRAEIDELIGVARHCIDLTAKDIGVS